MQPTLLDFILKIYVIIQLKWGNINRDIYELERLLKVEQVPNSYIPSIQQLHIIDN